MPDARMIAEWQEERSVLIRELDLLESGKMGVGGKVRGDDTARAIDRVKRRIAQLDAWLAGRAE
jgi:hypothetical protein